jgi:hypothetical protein
MSVTVMAKLGVDASAMNTGLAEAKGKMDRAAKDMAGSIQKASAGGGAGGAMGGMLGKLAGIGAGLFAADKIKDFVVGLTDMAGALMDMSDNLGVPVEKLQELQGVFGESGVGAEKFGKAMSSLNSKIEEAKGGSESAAADFAAFGVTMDDLRSKSPDEIMLQIADATAQMTSAGEKTVKLEGVFGKVGKSMVGAMSAGGEAIEQAGKSMRVLSEENAKALDQMGDDAARFWNGFKATSANALGFTVRAFKHTMGELGIGDKAESPFAAPKAPDAAAQAAEKAAKLKAEQERRFADEIAKFQKEREKQAEQTMLQHHEQRMAAEEQLAKRQEDAEKKVLDFRGKQKVEMRDLLHMMDQAKQIGGDIGGEFAAKAGQAKMDLVEAQTQRLLMSPAERVAADREARRVRHAQQKAQRMVERQIREGKIQDAAPAMQPMPPEAQIGKAATDLSAAAANLKGLKIVAITNN